MKEGKKGVDFGLSYGLGEYIKALAEIGGTPIITNKSAERFDPVRIQKNGPATIVFWQDGTKTIVKRGADEPESDYAAFTAALGIKLFGSNSALKKIVSRTETQKPKVKGAQKNKNEQSEGAKTENAEQAEQNEPQSAEQTEDTALIEKVAAKFGMTAEQALIAIKAARKQNEQKAKEGGAECQNTPV